MEKAKEYIYFWFCKDISNNKLEKHLDNFTAQSKIDATIYSFMHLGIFEYTSMKDILEKVYNDEKITDKDIERIIEAGQLNNMLIFLDIISEYNLKHKLLKQDKINILLDKLHERELTVQEIISKVSDPLDNRELLEQILNVGMGFEVATFYAKGDKRSAPKTNVSNNDKIDIYTDLFIKLIKQYAFFYRKKRFDMLSGMYSKEEHAKFYERMQKLTKTDAKKFAEDVVLDIPIEDEVLALIYNTIAIGGEHIGDYYTSLFRSRTKVSSKAKPEDKSYLNAPYDVRIYINGVDSAKSKNHLLFIKEYILQCIEKGLGYDMKSDQGNKDTIVFYSAIEELPKRVQILENIKKQHPDYILEFGSPISLGCTYGSGYYAIGHRGNLHGGMMTYTNYCDALVKYSIVYSLLNEIKANVKSQKVKESIDYCNKHPIKKEGVGKDFQLSDYLRDIIKELANNGTSISQLLQEKMRDKDKREQFVSRFAKVIRIVDNCFQGRPRSAHEKICCDSDIAKYIEYEKTRYNSKPAFSSEITSSEIEKRHGK